MIVTVLGCSGSAPGPAGPCSGYLVECEGYRLVVDLGTGALATLLGLCGPDQIDAVVLSHLHSDHAADLAALAYSQEKLGGRRAEPTIVLAPDGAARLAGDGWRVVAAAPGRHRFGPLTVTLAPARHQVPAFAIRVDGGGRSVGYTGDTGPAAEVSALCRGTDLLIANAALAPGAEPEPNHLTPAQAGALARDAGAGLLLLAHLRPWTEPDAAMRDARYARGATVVLAATGLRIAV